MLTVLLIDDEPILRAGMRSIIDWAGSYCEIIGEAADGQSGLALLEDLQPDIALVDVKMPGMSGIEMIRLAKGRGIGTKFIVLSGYSDFEFTKQAILLGVDAYLLKPVEEEELIHTLATLHVRILQERNTRGLLAKGHEELLSERIRLLIERGASYVQTEEALSLLGKPPYAVTLLWHTAAGGDTAPERARQVALCRAEGYFAFESDAVCAVLRADTEAGIRKEAQRLAQAFGRAGMEDLAWIVGTSAAEIGQLHDGWNAAREVLLGAFVYLDCPVVFAQDLLPCRTEKQAGRVEVLVEQITTAAKILDTEQVDQSLGALFALFQGGAYAEGEIKTIASNLILELLAKAKAQSTQPLPFDREGILLEMYQAENLRQLMDLLGTHVRNLSALMSDVTADTIVKRMVSYIEKNHAERLTLEVLGIMFGYNSAYLGRIFKKHTGVSFPEYLESARIERAKVLLREGMKVYQVSEQVGFSNQAYFGAKFKRRVGMSPKEYIQQGIDSDKK